MAGYVWQERPAPFTKQNSCCSSIFFDIVFLDIGLPGGSGFDLIPFIDQQSKIVFVTGHDDLCIKGI